MAQATMARFSIVALSISVGLATGCGTKSDAPAPPHKVVVKTPEKAIEPPPAVPPTATAEIGLQLVKNSELEAAIKAQKGKIVVVDFWATWCTPCKKEFPHLVELHRAHAKDGVVCMSVSIDEETEQGAALKFLRAQQAAFPNFLLNEEQDARQTKWKIKGVPVVYVFGRDGERVKKFDNDDPMNQFTYADVTKLVDELLRGKK